MINAIFALLICSAGDASATSPQCGTDYCGVPLVKLVNIHKGEFLKAGFGLVKLEIRKQDAVLRVSYPVQDSRYLHEMEIKFSQSAAGCVNGCASQYTIKEPQSYEPAERNAYVKKFASAHDRAWRGIQKRVQALWPGRAAIPR